jgi:aromatic ring-opening dioxygenase LigB subunit
MCHAPIVIPQIAAELGPRILNSTKAMRDAANFLVTKQPDVLVVISPHTPRLPSHFRIVAGENIAGKFGNFGHPELRIQLPNARDEANLLFLAAQETGAMIVQLEDDEQEELDHGSLVPLFFMAEAGWTGKTMVIGLPGSPTHADCRKLGRSIVAASNKNGKSWAILASGDMSHRLIAGAPAGYHPDARKFDEAFCKSINTGDLQGAVESQPVLREQAAEDVVDSVEVAGAAIDFQAKGNRLLSYEGPFGVGYLVAILFDASARSSVGNA